MVGMGSRAEHPVGYRLPRIASLIHGALPIHLTMQFSLLASCSVGAHGISIKFLNLVHFHFRQSSKLVRSCALR